MWFAAWPQNSVLLVNWLKTSDAIAAGRKRLGNVRRSSR